MPGVTLHFVLADRVLEELRRPGMPTPFDTHDTDHLNAFYHGAVGPDLGYFPGGVRVLSDLAHCVRTGVLTKVLLRTARTSLERAFAWGWLTHVLADVRVHPLIGRGVGEVLHGSRDRFVDGSSHPLTHLRVEMGLDAWLARSAPDVRQRRLTTCFDDDTVGFLVAAYARVYGVAVDPQWFLRSHRATTRRVGQALSSMVVVAALLETTRAPGVPLVRGILRAAYRRQALQSLGLAYLNPVVPASWLLEAVAAEAEGFTSLFMDVADSAGATLEDRNLDTGRLLATETEHPGTLRALEELAGLPPVSAPHNAAGLSGATRTSPHILGPTTLPAEA